MATASTSDHYKVLGVASDADAAAIKTAYRKLVLKCHPDKVSDPALKEQKQDEFQKVQQSYEVLSDPDKRQRYDLELRARELREERDRTRSRTTPATTRTANVRVSTNPDFRSPQSSPPKMSSYKSYSGATEYKSRDPVFATYRSKHSYEPEMRSGRSASDERLRRDDYRDSRESRRKEEEKESEWRRKKEKEELERRRYEKLHREAREREEREYRESQAKAAKAEKKAKEREREREKDRRKQAEDGDKARAKPRSPYVESYYAEDADDRKSRKTKSPKKDSSSTRDKSSSKLRDRSSARDDVPTPSIPPELPAQSDAMKFKLDFAANYISSKSKPLPKHAPEAPIYSESYPDPNIRWAAPQRRSSGEARHAQQDPIEIIDSGSPSRPEFDASSGQAAPPRLHKTHTAPPGQMYTSSEVPHVPTRATLNRAQTMDPEYLARSDRYKPPRGGRPSPEESRDDYYLDQVYAPKVQKYTVRRGDNHIPRVSESYYAEPTSSPSNGLFGKVKTSHHYRPENVERTRSYGMKDAATMEYNQPAFSANASAAVYTKA